MHMHIHMSILHTMHIHMHILRIMHIHMHMHYAPYTHLNKEYQADCLSATALSCPSPWPPRPTTATQITRCKRITCKNLFICQNFGVVMTYTRTRLVDTTRIHHDRCDLLDDPILIVRLGETGSRLPGQTPPTPPRLPDDGPLAPVWPGHWCRPASRS